MVLGWMELLAEFTGSGGGLSGRLHCGEGIDRLISVRRFERLGLSDGWRWSAGASVTGVEMWRQRVWIVVGKRPRPGGLSLR